MIEKIRLDNERLGGNDNLNLTYATELAYQSLQRAVSQLGEDFRVCITTTFETVPGKGYTAKFNSSIGFREKLLGRGQITCVLFRPGDSTGEKNNEFEEGRRLPYGTPRKKEDFAELFVSVGTAKGNLWLPGINFLEAINGDSFGPLNIYKCLTLGERPQAELLKNILADDKPFPEQRRFDFTLDRSQNYGDPHAIVWHESAPSPSYRNPYFQVGAFLGFPQDCEELRILRERIKIIEAGRIK